MTGRARLPRRLRESLRQRGLAAHDVPPPTALLVVRAWREGPGALGLRARIWRSLRLPDEPVREVTVTSLQGLEEAVLEWVEQLRSGGRPIRSVDPKPPLPP